MILSIHQPDYIPWLGTFYKMAHSDVFVYLDDAQYSNQAAHDFNVIKTPQGVHRLKIPVEQHLGDSICTVRTKDELDWKKKHLKTLAMNYGHAPFFESVFPVFEAVLQQEYPNLAALNMAVNELLCMGFGIHPKLYKSSDLKLSSVREERILDICEQLGATVYLSGNGARSYQEDQHFTARGVKLTYLDYQPIVYSQQWKGFLPCMSVLDYVLNCGFDWDFVEQTVKRINGQEA